MSNVLEGLAAPGGVAFLDMGIVTPATPSAIIASLRDPRSVAGEELRLLRSRLRGGSHGELRCLALTSALPAEGKSTLALGLAAAFAREPGRRVLLVEADLRKPTVRDRLGLPRTAGLTEWLNGGVVQVPIRQIQPGEFSVLVAGEEALKRPEALGSVLMQAVLSAARANFDDVIVDVPPLLSVSDAVLMQDLLDGFLLVVRSRATPRDAIRDALGRLRREKVVGVVLNDHRDYRHSYHRYAYEKYGMTSGPRSSRAGGRKPSRSGGASRRR